jgi:hypothetical protein
MGYCLRRSGCIGGDIADMTNLPQQATPFVKLSS